MNEPHPKLTIRDGVILYKIRQQDGRYSYADALAHSHPNGINGPRDGMSIKHESHTGGRND